MQQKFEESKLNNLTRSDKTLEVVSTATQTQVLQKQAEV